MSHYGTFTFLDETGEKSAMKFYHGAITATTLAGYLTQFGDLKAKTQALTRGTLHKERIVMDDTLLDSALPGDNLAQREAKLLVVYRDVVTNKVYTLTIPTVDLTHVTFVPGAKDNIRLDTTEVAEWITSFETLGRSPDNDANGVEVIQIRAVGRNS